MNAFLLATPAAAPVRKGPLITAPSGPGIVALARRACLWAVLAAAAPGVHALAMSRGIQSLPISYQECLTRAHRALVAEGYDAAPSTGAGFVGGFKPPHGAYIICGGGVADRSEVNVVAATEGTSDSGTAGNERVRLQQRMAGASPPSLPPVTLPPPAPQQPGTSCCATSPSFVEQGEHRWEGIYTRRGSSNVFDVTYSRAGQIDRGELTLDLVNPTEVRINRIRSENGYTAVLGARIGLDGVAHGQYPGGHRFNVRCTGASHGSRVPPPVTPLPPQRPEATTIVGGGAAAQMPPRGAPRLLGCFKDPNNPFDLDGHLVRSAQNTPQRCVQTCAAMGFKVAGVQYGQTCLCGNSYGRFGTAGNCNMRCTGDGSQVCGGINANSVYSTGR